MNNELAVITMVNSGLYSVEFCHNAHPHSLIKRTASQQALLKIKINTKKVYNFADVHVRHGHPHTLSGLQSMLEIG